MDNIKPIILAINPGTRYIGIAILDGSDLIDWGVKVIEGKWSPDKLVKVASVISELIMNYQPSIVIIKKTHPSRTSMQLDEVCYRIKSIAQKCRLKFHQYSIEDIKAFHGQRATTGKIKLAELVSLKYPALIRDLRKEQRLSNPYHMKMFEAVALAIACLRSLAEPYNRPVMFKSSKGSQAYKGGKRHPDEV